MKDRKELMKNDIYIKESLKCVESMKKNERPIDVISLLDALHALFYGSFLRNARPYFVYDKAF